MEGQGAEAAVLVTGLQRGLSHLQGLKQQPRALCTIKPVLLGQNNISQEFVEQISNATGPGGAEAAAAAAHSAGTALAELTLSYFKK